ncbi:Ppx/GppA phosphatase family protein [Catellatospora sp. KI3]|uniref:Ppx/GppA phosphatase family protein n=1 Tax=Catellatospora sp. KI3 TaxID=3041620 RepID=UPI0024824BCC|nr:Ppx/GppA phosphatase family protein [Catellatospora sp. KI3]MDI1460401.1 Ppx/GppA phosphatase family protein [Catellatospora sp. KI3]
MGNPVAAIDCGTNSIRLLITDDGRDLEREMHIVRLGAGVDRTGRLDPAAIERTRVALAEYVELIKRHDVDRVRMVATSATRDSANAADFHEMVRATLGRPAEVISGDEEAALSFRGAVDGLPDGGERLVIDIGGGSTEFVRGTREVLAAISMDIGSVRMTERHLRTDPPTADELAAATADIDAAVRHALGVVGTGPVTLVGVAGTVTTVAGIALGLESYRPELTHHAVVPLAAVEEIAQRLTSLDHAGRAAIKAIHPGRVDVIGAGVLILRQIMRHTGSAELVVSEHDILDGIATSLADPA